MASKKSQKYWEEREAEALKHYITEEEEFKKEIDKIYRDMLDSVQNEIYSFYGRYATKEGISMAEAKKRVSQADIKALERKAKQYVKVPENHIKIVYIYIRLLYWIRKLFPVNQN